MVSSLVLLEVSVPTYTYCHREGQSPAAISCLSLEEIIYLTKRKKWTGRMKFMRTAVIKRIQKIAGKNKNRL
jgi:hypothetical protein